MRWPKCKKHGLELRPANLVFSPKDGMEICVSCDLDARLRAKQERGTWQTGETLDTFGAGLVEIRAKPLC